MKDRTCHKKALREALKVGGFITGILAFAAGVLGIGYGVGVWTGSVGAAFAAGFSTFLLGLTALVYTVEYRDCVKLKRTR